MGLSLPLDMTLLFDFASEVVHEGMNLTGRYPFVRLHMRSCGGKWSSSEGGILCRYQSMRRPPSVAIEGQHSGQLAAMNDQCIVTTRRVQYQGQTDCGICKSVR